MVTNFFEKEMAYDGSCFDDITFEVYHRPFLIKSKFSSNEDLIY